MLWSWALATFESVFPNLFMKPNVRVTEVVPCTHSYHLSMRGRRDEYRKSNNVEGVLRSKHRDESLRERSARHGDLSNQRFLRSLKDGNHEDKTLPGCMKL